MTFNLIHWLFVLEKQLVLLFLVSLYIEVIIYIVKILILKRKSGQINSGDNKLLHFLI